ncbi:hypothetical protein NDU88_000806 [Pleurodeles waltl]|uniref:Uncharacterized protein n=1 Tax=Pleurodeles waltl TaxID=8319 RepID=A0AAV7KR72_PLEWA|nr:hypothetical protein NDU88_000806 [Pleurodeles waltl]
MTAADIASICFTSLPPRYHGRLGLARRTLMLLFPRRRDGMAAQDRADLVFLSCPLCCVKPVLASDTACTIKSAVLLLVAEEGREREEVVIVISDEEQEGQESFGFVERSIAEQDVNFLSRGAGADGLKESSLGRCSSIRSFEGNVSARNVLHVGEQVDLVDQEGVLVTGLVYGQVGRRVSRDKGKVLLDRWKPALQEVSAGCDAPRFPGRPGGLTVHQDAGRHAGGQSFPVKARVPLIHRKEGRVNSGAVYPTTRETVVRGSLGHGAGSVLGDEQPSTSWGAGASFKRLEETMLDYDDDEVDQDTRVAAPVLQSTVPEVVQGDHYGICRTSAGNLPRGELGMGMGRIVGGNYGREVCGFGGVNASVQVDGIKEDGAGKSEVTGDVREEDGSKVLQESVKAGGVVGAEVSVKGTGFPDQRGACGGDKKRGGSQSKEREKDRNVMSWSIPPLMGIKTELPERNGSRASSGRHGEHNSYRIRALNVEL